MVRLIKDRHLDLTAEYLYEEPPVYTGEQRAEVRYALWIGWLSGCATAGAAWLIVAFVRYLSAH